MSARTLGIVGACLALGASALGSTQKRLIVLGRLTNSDPASLYWIDPKHPSDAASPLAVTGVAGGDLLVSIANEPTTGQLYAYSMGRRLYKIDKQTGVANEVGSANTSLPTMNGGTTWFWIRFDPMSGVLRFVHLQHGNYRINKNDNTTMFTDGSLEFQAGDTHFGSANGIISFAYSNPHDAATSTLGYTMSGNDTIFTKVADPVSGAMSTVGDTGYFLWGIGGLAFDLDGTLYAASHVTFGGVGGPDSEMYSIDVDTGAATFYGEINAPSIDVFDIAFDYDPFSADRDDDGFPNSIEVSAGSDTRNPTITPFAGVLDAPSEEVVTTLSDRLRIKLKFDHANRDSIELKGSFQLPLNEEFDRDGMRIIADVGGSISTFDLDAKGKATASTGARLSVSKPSQAGVVKFKLTQKHASLASSFSDEGLVDANLTGAALSVDVDLWMATHHFGMTRGITYDAVAGKSGKAHE